MKKIILILSNNDGGLFNFRKELICKLLESGNIVYVSVPKGRSVEKLEELGCIHVDTPMNRRGKNPISDIKLLLNYINLIKKLKPDVVLTYTIKPNIYGGIACSLLKVPYITNITGLGTSIENKGLIQKISLYLYKIGIMKAECIFFQNEANMNFFIKRKIANNKIRLIPGSGVNLKKFTFEEYPPDDEVMRFLFVGRIMKAKGIDELVNASQIIKKEFSNVQFDIIGSMEEDYTNSFQELITNNVINYLGSQKDVHSFMKNSHAIIHPSHHEGMSNVLLEAAATGRPVIASKIPGCIETFDENISGIGFEVKNVDSLVKAIKKFIELPYEEKKKMGIAGRKKIEKEFDRNIVIDAYMDEIEKIIGG